MQTSYRSASLLLALVLALSSEAGAGAPTERLDTFFTKVGYILGGIETEADFHDRLPAIRRQVSDIFDARAAAERVLGREWQARTPAERDEFVSLFSGLLERAFLARIGANVDVIDGVKCRYLSETIDGDQATVVVAMTMRGGTEMPVEYRLVRRDDRWSVSDVVVDGVSLVANYGAQFSRVLGLGAYPELLARMRARSGQPMVAAAPAERASDARDERPLVTLPPLIAPSPIPRAPIEPASAAPPGAPVPVAVAPATPPPAAKAPDVPPPPVAPPPPVVPAPPPLATAPPLSPPGVTPVEPPRAAPPPAAVGRPEPVVVAVATPPPPPAPPREPAPARALAKRATPDLAPSARGRAPSYWVQLGAFKTADAAVALVTRLGNEDITIVTEPPSANGHGSEPLFRVRVGPFPDHARAVTKLRDLRRAGFESFVVAER
jgi:phospholipid transport system substrate-binding protein